jgi:hypothetical protein
LHLLLPVILSEASEFVAPRFWAQQSIQSQVEGPAFSFVYIVILSGGCSRKRTAAVEGPAFRRNQHDMMLKSNAVILSEAPQQRRPARGSLPGAQSKDPPIGESVAQRPTKSQAKRSAPRTRPNPISERIGDGSGGMK